MELTDNEIIEIAKANCMLHRTSDEMGFLVQFDLPDLKKFCCEIIKASEIKNNTIIPETQLLISFIEWYREDDMSKFTPQHLAEWYFKSVNLTPEPQLPLGEGKESFCVFEPGCDYAGRICKKCGQNYSKHSYTE